MKRKLGITLGALALASGLAYAAGPGGWGCDGSGVGMGYGMGMGLGMGPGMHGGMGYGMQGGMDPDRMVDRLDRRLSLTDEQEAQVFQLLQQQQAKHRSQHETLWQLLEQQRQLDPGSADYVARSAAMAKQRAALMEGFMAERAQLQADIHAVLTPEQQQQFRSLREQGFGHPRGKGSGHGGWGMHRS